MPKAPAVRRPVNRSRVIRSTTDYVHLGSRQDMYLAQQIAGIEKAYIKYRKPGIDLFKRYRQLLDSEPKFIQHFRIRGIGYGQWVTQEARYSYLAALLYAIHDLDGVLKFKGNIGLHGHLAISVGARGQGRALAHFEPGTFIINLTRYHDGHQIMSSGGVGSFAHEYGHALDYFIGFYYENSGSYHLPLSTPDGRYTNYTPAVYDAKKQPGRYAMERFLQYTRQHTKLFDRLKRDGMTPYWFKRNEVFARVFEQYISYQLQKRGITNAMLVKTKYKSSVYLTPAELKKAIPLIDRIVAVMRMYISK